jgi:hypothetical protein
MQIRGKRKQTLTRADSYVHDTTHLTIDTPTSVFHLHVLPIEKKKVKDRGNIRERRKETHAKRRYNKVADCVPTHILHEGARNHPPALRQHGRAPPRRQSLPAHAPAGQLRWPSRPHRQGKRRVEDDVARCPRAKRAKRERRWEREGMRLERVRIWSCIGSRGGSGLVWC